MSIAQLCSCIPATWTSDHTCREYVGQYQTSKWSDTPCAVTYIPGTLLFPSWPSFTTFVHLNSMQHSTSPDSSMDRCPSYVSPTCRLRVTYVAPVWRPCGARVAPTWPTLCPVTSGTATLHAPYKQHDHIQYHLLVLVITP